MKGAGFMDFCGYSKCPVLSNTSTRVILGPHCGGRVLEYALNGVNVIKLDPKQEGWMYVSGKPGIDPYGGRLDIGPEMVIPQHPNLWFGSWQAETIGERAVRLTSPVDKPTGVQLIREFELAENSTHLRCTQIIKNVSETPRYWCHWSRTLAVGGGICVIPLTPNSRFPNKYIMYGPDAVISYRPDDKNITVSNDFLIISGAPRYPKLGIDSYAGWFSYLMKNNIMFVKRFPVYPDRVYNEMAAITISIYYYADTLCELEPIGPKENLKPGESASFTEDWHLVPFNFPLDGKVDPVRARNSIPPLQPSP